MPEGRKLMRGLLAAIVNLLGWFFSLGFTMIIIGSIVGVLVYNHYDKDLPDYTQLANYDPATMTRLYAANGKLLAEYATEKRVFVPLQAIPKRLVQAFISAEDKNFYQHDGIDVSGIARAVRDNIINYGQGKSLVGGSTITQQVVKNFLLTSEKSIERKAKEAILALRISRIYSKEKILELYLNQIYLGLGSYGVAAAAQNYFNKSLDDITIEEAALLAAQPKAPTLYNPRKNYSMAKERRDWIIDRMREDGHISAELAEEAKKTEITLRNRDVSEIAHADFFAEEVRRKLGDMYGSNVLYEGGLVVKTTVDPQLQQVADNALRKALIEYDRRRGYRGALAQVARTGSKTDERPDGWKEQLQKLTKEHDYHLLEDQKLGLVTGLDDKKATFILHDETTGTLPHALMKWTRRVVADGQLGPEVKRPADILKLGDVVIVGPITEEHKKLLDAVSLKTAWDLQQIPEVNGAMVVIDPHTGRVLAMSGGYAYGGTEFNRATQAKRQPGSAFKPFVYLAGLENGFSPTTVILDAPVEMSQGEGLPTWKPQNYHDEYLGPTTMRVGLEKSRNTMTVRMAQVIGLDKVLEVGRRFGIYDKPAPNFSIVLGSGETTLLRLTNAYGMLVNGGKRITPSIIERIDDRHGKIIYRRDSRQCDGCMVTSEEDLAVDQGSEFTPPMPPDTREQVIDARIAYQMVSMLEGVCVRGTATRSKDIGKIVAGKTGTTNDSMDTWFIGFTPDLVAGVYIGYDQPRTLGKRETGGSTALPAFVDFMKTALKDQPNTPFRVPPGIRLARIDLKSGLPVSEAPVGEELKIIEEAFMSGGSIYIPGVTPADDKSNLGDIVPVPDISELSKPSSPETGGLPAGEAMPIPLETPPVMGTGSLY
jgi:penicillin-binding protein 1A